MIEAKIIADSINEFGNRITTFVLTFPRIILSEFNTHRILSRNSASSRAIPFKKMVKMVEENPFIPIKWMKDHKGMQGTEYETGDVVEWYTRKWLQARNHAISKAKELSEMGLTKQICNRLLEPFMYHTCICTGTEWENFFALRAHPDAEIHIADLAHKMLEAYNKSVPKKLKAGEWHIPFGDKFDGRLLKLQRDTFYDDSITELKIKIATARCARVSYLNFDGIEDYWTDIKLHDILVASGHWSPMEHCAQAMGEDDYNEFGRISNNIIDAGWCGNFKGWIQYRKMFENENKTDERVKK
jgi:thymidylate synthase ThyX